MAKTTNSHDRVSIAYEVHGSGDPALVFVHGWACDRGSWAEQIGPLSRTHRLVAIDLAGHGESGRERTEWTIAAFGADVAAVVKALELERVVLIGHSMGGDVIVEAARRLPGRVAGLVWVDTYTKIGAPRTPEQVRTFLAPFRANFAERARLFVRVMFLPGSDAELVERVAADMSAAPPPIAIATLKSAVTYDREIPGALRELGLPVIAINPDNRATDIDNLKSHGVDVVIMRGVGHFPMMEDPEAFNILLKETIARFAERPLSA